MAGLGAGMQMMMGHEGASGWIGVYFICHCRASPGHPSALQKGYLRRWMDTRVKPAYDTEYEVRRITSIRKRLHIVFSAFQNAGHHAVGGESADRRRSGRCGPAGHAICIAGAQAHYLLARAT